MSARELYTINSLCARTVYFVVSALSDANAIVITTQLVRESLIADRRVGDGVG